ncbi:predicted protein [Streptomyces viridosporus ATCC 14672]|uniref:Predicted protein n=1 Tax=Streptomyces viridosporus (strain ATCC 14672 / DSM 40746 / JCM 4963 / KCTC 9882 / NRRL B-12104 / FH 1290) TaxID=566461 RepID=D5ZP91_STRV1|nr:predicted protein [Streptomyces viridosporus ATCC 14672]
MGAAPAVSVPGQFTGRPHQLRGGARGVLPHAGEQLGHRAGARAGEELADGEVVDQGTGGEIPVTGGGAVSERLGEGSGPPQPLGGPPVQLGFQTGPLHPQMGAEDLPEQGVEAVLAVPEVLDERVPTAEPGQDGPGVGPAREHVGELGAEPVEQADPQQQVLGLVVLPPEHLRQQVVGDRAVIDLELLEVPLRIRALPCRQGAQPQPGGPPPGALQKRAHGGRGQPQPVQLQQFGRFPGSEGQLRAPDLRQLTGGAVAVQGQQRLGPGDEDQPQSPPGVAQHELQLLRDLRCGDPVVLVEHHDHGLLTGAQPGGEPGRQGRGHPARVRREADVLGQGDAGGAQGPQQVRPEHPRPLTGRIGGEPGDDRPVTGLRPVRHQQCLPRARGAVDHGQRRPEGFVEMPGQPLPPQERHRSRGHGEPGVQERVPLRVGHGARRRRAVPFEFRHGAHRPCSSGFTRVHQGSSGSVRPRPCALPASQPRGAGALRERARLASSA